MASRIEWRDEARDDLDRLFEYLSASSLTAAIRYADEIEHATKQLADFPESGRPFSSAYRVLVVRHHLVLYRVVEPGRDVLIVNIFDSRRDPDALLIDLEDPH